MTFTIAAHHSSRTFAIFAIVAVSSIGVLLLATNQFVNVDDLLVISASMTNSY